MRPGGKSTLPQQLIDHYRLDPEHWAFLNLEDRRLSGAQSHVTLDRLVVRFRERHESAETLYFFLDRAQAYPRQKALIGEKDGVRWARMQRRPASMLAEREERW